MRRLSTDDARRKEVTLMQVMGAQDHGQAERQKKAIDFALASVGPEGFALPPEVEAINRQYIDGELTGDEHIAAIKAAVLHGKQDAGGNV